MHQIAFFLLYSVRQNGLTDRQNCSSSMKFEFLFLVNLIRKTHYTPLSGLQSSSTANVLLQTDQKQFIVINVALYFSLSCHAQIKCSFFKLRLFNEFHLILLHGHAQYNFFKLYLIRIMLNPIIHTCIYT